MIIDLEIISWEEIEIAEEIADAMGLTIDLNTLPSEVMIFYNVSAIKHYVEGYSCLLVDGYEYIVKMPFDRLMLKINKQIRY